ncbi:hypothetical protein DL768_002211 [Monosporascus sp. mg162]|nr:hypothetical protein DL768_002211 [Monosporascus sp. mg162]
MRALFSLTGVRASRYREHKIDSIGDRLANVEEILRELAITTRRLVEEASRAKSCPSIEETSIAVTSAVDPSSTVRHFEGDTSLSAYATFTSNHLERRLHNTGLLSQDPDLAAALSSLRQIVSDHNIYPSNQDFPTIQIGIGTKQKYSMPPAEVVSQVLRDVKGVYDSVISLFYPVRPYESIMSLCKDLYFSRDDMSTASLIVACGSLYYIFRCYYLTFTTEDQRRADFKQYCEMLSKNMMDLLGQLSLFVTANNENVEALLLAAYYTVQSSKPSLCSVLTSKAADLCFTMGYHRADSMTSDSPELRERKISLFWFLYILDKSLCLRLGRASIIQDYDIAIPMPDFSSADRDHTGIRMLHFWIKLSEVQGRVYEDLYSPHDQSLSCSQECVAAARQALELHQNCVIRYGTMVDNCVFSEFLHLTLLHTPFTPFLVIFCHIIKNQSTDDLKILGDFIGTLQPARGVSSSVEKMFLVCNVFYRVAKLFVEAASKTPSYSASTAPDVSAQLRKELDPFMTRTGTFPFCADDSNGNRYSKEDANANPGQLDPTHEFDPFVPMANIGEWFSDDQLIATLLGDNFNSLDSTTAQADNYREDIV